MSVRRLPLLALAIAIVVAAAVTAQAQPKYDWEPGEFIIQVGGNSRDTKSAKINWSK